MFSESLFQEDEEPLDDVRGEVGPWKFKGFHPAAQKDEKPKKKEKSLTTQRNKRRFGRNAILEGAIKQNNHVLPTKDVELPAFQRKNAEEPMPVSHTFNLPSVQHKNDSLSNFERVTKNRNYSPLAKDLKRLLEPNSREKAQKANYSVNGLEKYLRKERSNYDIYEKCIREHARVRRRYRSIEL